MARSIYLVQGNVALEADAKARKLRVVQGDVTLGERARSSAISVAEGRVRLANGAAVDGDIRSQDGLVIARDALVSGDVVIQCGGIELRDHTHVTGSLRVDAAPDGECKPGQPAHVFIGAGVSVDGPVDIRRTGTVLQISRHAHVGQVHGATVQWFDDATAADVGGHG